MHHKHYRNFGHEKDEDLQVVCKNCHPILDRRRRAKAQKQKLKRRVQAWASVVYGSDWRSIVPYEIVKRRFRNWLKRKSGRAK